MPSDTMGDKQRDSRPIDEINHITEQILLNYETVFFDVA